MFICLSVNFIQWGSDIENQIRAFDEGGEKGGVFNELFSCCCHK